MNDPYKLPLPTIPHKTMAVRRRRASASAAAKLPPSCRRRRRRCEFVVPLGEREHTCMKEHATGGARSAMHRGKQN